MSMSGWPSIRWIPWLGIGACILAVPCVPLAATPAAAAPQTAVLVSGKGLMQHKLPAFLRIGPGRYLAARVVQRACAGAQRQPGSLLLYLPDSQRCEVLSRQDTVALRQRLQQLTGQWPATDLRRAVREQAFVAVNPAPAGHALARALCTCPGNAAPTGSVDCAAQTRTAGETIGAVTFAATDADGDALSSTFSYQRDANPVVPGLPSSLASSCSSGTGSLQCMIQGNAPAPAGVVQLNFAVNDGSATLHLDSLLEILAPVESRIFADAFEFMGCL